MTTAAMYLRLSADDGRQGESQSIQGQRLDCHQYAERQGWTVAEFVDDGYSGSKVIDRPGYTAMLEAMASGEVGAVVVAKQDRLTRRGDAWEDFKATAILSGCAVHTVEAGDLRLESDAGMLSADIRSVFASFEARVIGSRTKRGLATSRANGDWTNGPTFGYDRGGVLNAEQAKWVRWAYDEILERGTSTREVFNTFRAEGVRTSRGNLFGSVSNLITTLRLPALAGLVSYQGEIVGTGNWTPIVTPDERDRLDAAIRGRATISRGYGQRTARKYPLSGIVLCGNGACDLKSMVAQNPGNGRNHYYYCDPRRGGCKNRAKGRELESAAGSVFASFLADQSGFVTEPAPFDDAELRSLDQQLADVRSMMVSREMRASDAQPVLKGLNERRDALDREREAYQVKVESWHARQFSNVFDSETGSLTINVRKFIDNVTVIPGRAGFRWESTAGSVHETLRTEDGAIQIA